MKRVILILSCVSIFCAGVLWALQGCSDIDADHDLFHQVESAVSNHHAKGSGSHHLHPDPTRVHCPNVFDEFLVSPRVTPISDHSYVYHLALAGKSVRDFLSDATFGSFGNGPPGPHLFKILPRHLVLSVIRV
jgi:hypothetical protein